MRPAQWAAARRAYEAGETAAAVAEKYGVTAQSVYRHIRSEGWGQRQEGQTRQRRMEMLYDAILTRLEAAVAETEGGEADKLGKLLTAAEKLDKLCGEPTATAIQVELGAAEEYAE